MRLRIVKTSKDGCRVELVTDTDVIDVTSLFATCSFGQEEKTPELHLVARSYELLEARP